VQGHPTAAILTIGNEIVSGDTENTNGSWLARRLEQLGVVVKLIAAVPDEIDAIVDFVARESPRVDHLLVTGGLGGTPDDVTREAIAAAFGVGQEEHSELAGRLREQFPHAPDHAAEWARLPEGARPLEVARAGPGFVIGNVYVLPGLPALMETMFESVADELRRERPIEAWRRTFETRESEITPILVEAGRRYPSVLVGSYPSFTPEGPRVEVVVKSGDPELLRKARAWLEAELDSVTRNP
jgi:nicotinamide-nucleotide amidase